MEFLAGNIEITGNIAEQELWEMFEKKLQNEEGILGYKIPAIGNRKIDRVPSFFLRSKKYGIVLIDVMDEKLKSYNTDGDYWFIENDDNPINSKEIIISDFESDLKNRLRKSTKLFEHRAGEFKIKNLTKKIIIFYKNRREEIKKIEQDANLEFFVSNFTREEIDTKFSDILIPLESEIDENSINEIDSILESTDIFNKINEVYLSKLNNENDFIQKSLKNTFKLDEIQRKVALQLPNGPQRIRGLAGTGKTIILCLKAALAHRNKNLRILFVFNTQSMYNQITNNIQRYYNEESGDLVDWNNLKVFHAWGGKSKEGIYSYLCKKYEHSAKTFYDVKSSGDPYEYIYDDFLKNNKDKIIPEFDLVLIDEAQDFPPKFFETIFYITKDPKRIIWAYDEFQSLKEMKISSPSEMFGLKKDGSPNISDSDLIGFYSGKIEKDYILPNSYRNPRKVLMYAHGLGMGLYSKDAKYPMKDRISWEARGYKINSPNNKAEFEFKDIINAERPDEFSKNNLEVLIKDNPEIKLEPIIQFNKFENVKEELDYVVKKVDELVNIQNVAPEEIIIISLNNKAEKYFKYLRSKLNNLDKQILCIIPGFVESTDLFKEKDRVTLTTAFRAKGNEANFVFVICCDVVSSDLRLRNSLFVSITRSRGWTYLTGSGNTEAIVEEISQLENKYPKFEFEFPKKSDIERRAHIISREDTKENRIIDENLDKILLDEKNIALLIEKAKDNPTSLELLKKLLNGDN